MFSFDSTVDECMLLYPHMIVRCTEEHPEMLLESSIENVFQFN